MPGRATDQLLDALREHGSAVKEAGVDRAGRDRWMAQCPAPEHDDHTPSLSVTDTETRVLFHCFAGCSGEAVLEALELGGRDLFHKRNTVYDYGGELKSTRKYTADGTRTFSVKGDTKDRLRPLYRVERVKEAVAAGEPVWVVEGEEDARTVELLGGVGTTSLGGAEGWARTDASPLRGATVHLVPDRDPAGTKYATAVRKTLARLDCTVRLFESAAGKDISDHYGAGFYLEDLKEVEAGDLPDVNDDDDDEDEDEEDEEGEGEAEGEAEGEGGKKKKKRRSKSIAARLVQLARQRYDLHISDTGEPFALPKDGPRTVHMLRGGRHSLRQELAQAFFEQYGTTASAQALSDTLLLLEAYAAQIQPRPLHLRVARHQDDTLWLDLGDDTGDAVHITPDGWSIEPPPLLFCRTKLTVPLPKPEHGGAIDDLWRWCNVEKDDRPLVLAWLVSALIEPVPHPILTLQGEAGAAKTTTAKVLGRLVDPTTAPVRKAPRDADAWITAAAGSWVVPIDNLADVAGWLSEALCRGVTGDADVRRKLFTDSDLVVIAFRRAIILTGIDLGALAGDLADRVLPVSLRRIPDEQRLEETDLEREWTRLYPQLLGALLDLAVRVLHEMPCVELTARPRMADFGRVLAAVDRVLGTKALNAYMNKQQTMAADAIASHPFITEVEKAIEGGAWEGRAADLLDRIPRPERPSKDWPSNARIVTTLLRRHAPALRKTGWTVFEWESKHDKVVLWRLVPPQEVTRSEGSGDSDPQDPPAPQSGADQQEQHDDHAGQADEASPHEGGSNPQESGGSDDPGGRPSESAGQKNRRAGNGRSPDPHDQQDVSAGQDDVAGQAGNAGQNPPFPLSVTCVECGNVLDPVHVAEGHPTCPGCDPDGE